MWKRQIAHGSRFVMILPLMGCDSVFETAYYIIKVKRLRSFVKESYFKLILWHIERSIQEVVVPKLLLFCNVNCFFAKQNMKRCFEFSNKKFGELN